MIRSDNLLTKKHTPVLVAVIILLVAFGMASLLKEAIAAKETAQSKDSHTH